MHLCEMKKKNTFYSIMVLWSQKGVTNIIVRQTNKSLGKSYTKAISTEVITRRRACSSPKKRISWIFCGLFLYRYPWCQNWVMEKVFWFVCNKTYIICHICSAKCNTSHETYVCKCTDLESKEAVSLKSIT